MRAASIREKACARGRGEWKREREREGEAGKEKALLSQYILIFSRGPTMWTGPSRNCPSASALIECLSLLFPKGAADSPGRHGRDLYKNVKLSGRAGEERTKSESKNEKERNERVWVSEWRERKKEHERRERKIKKRRDEAPDNAKAEETWLRGSHINNYCYSVMTDVGHGKTR